MQILHQSKTAGKAIVQMGEASGVLWMSERCNDKRMCTHSHSWVRSESGRPTTLSMPWGSPSRAAAAMASARTRTTCSGGIAQQINVQQITAGRDESRVCKASTPPGLGTQSRARTHTHTHHLGVPQQHSDADGTHTHTQHTHNSGWTTSVLDMLN